MLSCFIAAQHWCSSGFEAHSSHQLFVDSPSHGSHQSASQRPGYGPAKKPTRAMLLRERAEQDSSVRYAVNKCCALK